MGFKAKIVLLLLAIIINTVDIISDWMVYHEVSDAEAGLVFGPFEETFRKAYLAFCIIGSIILPLEPFLIGLSIQYEDLAKGPLLDIVTLIAVWLEEVPQMVLNVMIVACRDEPISVFQVTKAAICIVSVIIRLVMVCYLMRRSKKKEQMGCFKVKACTVPGVILVFIMSCVVFSFSNFSYENGRLEFYHPRNLFEGEFQNRGKYLDDVGLFVNFKATNEQSPLAIMQKEQWIKLAKVDEIGPDKKASLVKLQYGLLDNGKQLLVVSEGHQSSFPEVTECYTKDVKGIVELLNNSMCQLITSTVNTTDLILKFEFIEKTQHLIMGDISYNFLTKENGKCQGLDQSVIDFDKLGQLEHRLAYLKLADKVNSDHHLYVSGSEIHFFSLKRENVQDVQDVWKTGFFNCEASGRPYPRLNKQLSVPCI